MTLPDPRPLVSCVVPTRDRPAFLRRAVGYWSRQTYPEREMIVVDDSREPALLPDVPGLRHLHVPPSTQGAKLNLGIECASGSVMQKWDDDDIYRPAFLETAVGALQRSDAGFVLWDCYLFLLAWTGEIRFSGHGHKAGPSLCFTRETWTRGPFRPLQNAVDSHFIADHAHRYTPVCGVPEMLVLVRHGANTWRRFWDTDVDAYLETRLERWPGKLADLVGPGDLAFYAHMQQTNQGRPGTVNRS